MQIRKVIKRRIHHVSNGVDIAGDLNAAISANVGERNAAAALNVLGDDSSAVPEEENANHVRGRREEGK